MLTKRTQNAALIRHNILSFVTNSCKSRDFASVRVTEICEASNISKVTFFKYFDKKEDVLFLYQSILNTDICVEVSRNNLQSLEGLKYIIDRFNKSIRETPSIARELVAGLLHTKPPILPYILTEADREFFFPGVDFENVSIMPFIDLIEKFMLEAILNTEISEKSDASELATMYISVLYGAIVASHIKGPEQQAIRFNNICKSWLRCLN
ncbi:MAG: TetR/AcrR family transcriptional regulator [Bacteroidota bacterium]